MNQKSAVVLLLVIGFAITLLPLPVYAQSDEAGEQASLRKQEQREERMEKVETAEDIMKMLIERAKSRLETKRKEMLSKTKISVSSYIGFETNPLNDSAEKGDWFIEEDFYFDWIPTFNEHLGADLGYWLIYQPYSEQTDLSSVDHAVNATLKYTPFKNGKLKLEPGYELEWLEYLYDEASSYEDSKLFLKFKHYAGRKWNWGGRYEHSAKTYNKKKARDGNQNSINLNREDNRDTLELYVTKYIGKYSVKLKGKAYRNTSNDSYQDYYDYDSVKGYITLARSFLKDDKLYVSFSPSYEEKQYIDRINVDTGRYDNVTNYSLNAYYTLNKTYTLNYSFTFKEVDSNYLLGEYKDVTNKVGITADF